jgi:adenylate cyclase
MDRIWQWAWDRCGARYSWAICAISFLVVLPTYLLTSFLVVAFERPGHYDQAAVATVIAALVICYYAFLPSGRR